MSYLYDPLSLLINEAVSGTPAVVMTDQQKHIIRHSILNTLNTVLEPNLLTSGISELCKATNLHN